MKKISLEDRDYFYACKPLYQFISCEYSFSNLMFWGDLYNIQWRDLNGVPLIYLERDDSVLFPQIPEMTPDVLLKLFEKLRAELSVTSIIQTPFQYVEQYPEFKELLLCTAEPDFADYIHSTERLTQLSGKKLRKKRNLIAQFTAAYPDYEICELGKKHFDDCLALAEKGGTMPAACRYEEHTAMERAFALYDALGLGGVVVYVKGVLVGFTVFGRNIDDTCIIHFEKNDREFKGSGQFINFQTADFLKERCDFLNREQDLGLLGLRKAKRSYDPDCLLENYKLQLLQ